jgi:hypothetical protein
MPLISTLGAASSRGFGQFAQSSANKYIEDYFSTWLYTGNGSWQTISNGIQLGTTIVQPVGLFGSNTGLSVANNAALLVSNSENFTMECWVNQTTVTGNQLLFGKTNTSAGDGGNFLVYSSSTGEWNVWFNGNPEIYGSNTPVANVWNHVAVSRSGSTVRIFVNGTNVGSGSYSGAITNTGPFKIGTIETSGFASTLKGYVTNFRFVKGTALYTSNFTPPTSQLTAVSGTDLLTLQSPSLFVDNSTNNFTVTNYSVTSQTVSSPFIDSTITGAGGLVWMKGRSGATDHALYDTARGATFELISNSINTQTTQATGLTAFTASGFSIGSLAKINTSSATYVSWTWRETPKFFDIVTYTGTGSARTISHNLGSEPGMMIIKKTIGVATEWAVYHRSLLATQALQLEDTTAAFTATNFWNSTRPTSTVFSLGAGGAVNASGATFVAYLFAHNAGGFGLDGSQNVISCGSFTTDGSGNATVNLGYEPQYIITKRTDAASQWAVFDNMRGMSHTNTNYLFANLSNSEVDSATAYAIPTATGVEFKTGFWPASSNIIYMAIRRGPMKVPTDATTVFSPVARTGTSANASISAGFATDAVLIGNRDGSSGYGAVFWDKLRGAGVQLRTFSSNGEATASDSVTAFTNNGISVGADTANYSANRSSFTYINWLLQRAPSFFDLVCFSGTGSARTVSHNLGVAPELMIVKRRDTAGTWFSYHPAIGNTKYVVLNTNAASATASTIWNDTSPTSLVFTVGTSGSVNASGGTFVAYLFATCAGVSKVGSYTGTGTTLQINCGFTAGARFVLIKRTDSTGDWYVWDSARGIIAGNDPYLLLNNANAEVTNTDYVDAYSAGFELSSTAPAALNANGGTYIFLAIA